MTGEFPVFDEEWVAGAQHRELSVAQLKSRRRQTIWADRRRRGRKILITIVTVAMFAVGAWYLGTSRTWNRDQNATGSGNVAERIWQAEIAGDRPTPKFASDQRLLYEVIPSEPSSTYAYMDTNEDGSPIRFDPCRPISIVVNPAGAPSDYPGIVDRATRRATAASGLVFDVIGETDEPPTLDRPMYNPDRYGNRWAPVLIAWTDQTVIPNLAGSVGGIGASGWTSYDSEPGWYVSGLIYLDVDLGPDSLAHESVLLHELGHVLGLDHVDDPSELMFGESTVTDLGPGDLVGLARVGAGPCAGLL